VKIFEAAQVMWTGGFVKRGDRSEKYFSDGYGVIHAMTLNDKLVRASVNLDDLLADDWEIVE